MIPLARPSLGAEEIAAAADVLKSGMLVQGERVVSFETSLAGLTGRREAVVVSSGTGALELALEALGVGPGDEVLVPDFTWPSPAHAVKRRGATPILVDVDPAEWNAGPEAFVARRSERTRAAIVIDQFGAPARHQEIAFALRDLPIIEDAACAIGSVLNGLPAGSFGTVSCLSFHPRKIVTTGEGGAVVTDDPRVAERLRTLRNHGQERPGVFREAAGNHRLTEMAAAIGLVQLERLEGFLVRRRALGVRYRELLDGLPLRPQAIAEGAVENVQTFGVVLDPEVLFSRDDVLSALREAGVQAGILSYALHRLGTAGTGTDDDFPHASHLADRGLALPLYDELSHQDQDLVVAALRSILGER
jgi:perosamine synthetase